MLQQTRVETVVPYFLRFVERFPDVRRLAAATEAEVLALWSGLGLLLARARAPSRGPDRRRGSERPFSRGRGGLDALPGVGRYTAGAVVSIAFGKPAPILDGNVARVLTRLYGLRGDPRSATLNRELWTLAEGFLPRRSISRLQPGAHGARCARLHAAVPAMPCLSAPRGLRRESRRTSRSGCRSFARGRSDGGGDGAPLSRREGKNPLLSPDANGAPERSLGASTGRMRQGRASAGSDRSGSARDLRDRSRTWVRSLAGEAQHHEPPHHAPRVRSGARSAPHGGYRDRLPLGGRDGVRELAMSSMVRKVLEKTCAILARVGRDPPRSGPPEPLPPTLYQRGIEHYNQGEHRRLRSKPSRTPRRWRRRFRIIATISVSRT